MSAGGPFVARIDIGKIGLYLEMVMKSPHSQLSNGENIVENGYNHGELRPIVWYDEMVRSNISYPPKHELPKRDTLSGTSPRPQEMNFAALVRATYMN